MEEALWNLLTDTKNAFLVGLKLVFKLAMLEDKMLGDQSLQTQLIEKYKDLHREQVWALLIGIDPDLDSYLEHLIKNNQHLRLPDHVTAIQRTEQEKLLKFVCGLALFNEARQAQGDSLLTAEVIT